MAPGGKQDPSIRALVVSATSDAQRLVKAQLELAQAEIRADSQTIGATAGMFIGAAVLAFLGFVFLLVTAAYVLVQLGLPVWAGFGIVTLVLLIVAIVLGLLGRRRARQIKGLEQTKQSFAATTEALSGRSAAGRVPTEPVSPPMGRDLAAPANGPSA